jgi:hypothetical protein
MRSLHSRAALLVLLGLAGCTVKLDENKNTGGGGAESSTSSGAGRPDTPTGGKAATDGGSTALAGKAGGTSNGGRKGGGAGGKQSAGSGGRGGAAVGGTSAGAGGKDDSATAGALKPPCAACAKASSACEDTTPAPGSSRAAAIAAKLGRAHFLIGMGNDLDNDHSKDGAYTLGTTLDLHYAYMVGLPGMGGWPDWNSDGTFVNILADSAANNCVTPMYTMYSMAAWGDGNLAGLSDSGYMGAYWSAAKLLFQRIAEFDKPAVVHIEPDFWAYAAQQSNQNPASMKVLIASQAPDCVGLPENLVGMGKCWIKLARSYAPKALVGFHASQWGGSPTEIVSFFNAIGAADSDMIFMDMLDRDAGCFEAAQDPNCKRQGQFYWDETNATSPNFHEYLSYAKQVSDGLGKPILWWQVPFGVPSDTPGGTADHYRDNRVKYIFSHVDEFVAAGGLGVTFGTGAGNQTSWTTDDGQFKKAVATYFQNPTRLP